MPQIPVSAQGCRLAQEPTVQNTTSRAKFKNKDCEAGVSRMGLVWCRPENHYRRR